MEFFELLRHRKSVRKFTDKPIPEGELSKILLAANAAPIGSNQYKDIHLTVVQNRDVLDKLSKAAEKRWEDKAKMKQIIGDMPMDGLEKKLYDPFYGAPVVVFISHRKQDIQPGIEYSNVACVAYSMHLAATDLGLGSVFMWGALESMREIPELDNTDILGLPDDFEPLIGIAIGYSQNELSERELKSDKMTINYL